MDVVPWPETLVDSCNCGDLGLCVYPGVCSCSSSFATDPGCQRQTSEQWVSKPSMLSLHLVLLLASAFIWSILLRFALVRWITKRLNKLRPRNLVLLACLASSSLDIATAITATSSSALQSLILEIAAAYVAASGKLAMLFILRNADRLYRTSLPDRQRARYLLLACAAHIILALLAAGTTVTGLVILPLLFLVQLADACIGGVCTLQHVRRLLDSLQQQNADPMGTMPSVLVDPRQVQRSRRSANWMMLSVFALVPWSVVRIATPSALPGTEALPGLWLAMQMMSRLCRTWSLAVFWIIPPSMQVIAQHVGLGGLLKSRSGVAPLQPTASEARQPLSPRSGIADGPSPDSTNDSDDRPGADGDGFSRSSRTSSSSGGSGSSSDSNSMPGNVADTMQDKQQQQQQETRQRLSTWSDSMPTIGANAAPMPQLKLLSATPNTSVRHLPQSYQVAISPSRTTSQHGTLTPSSIVARSRRRW